MASIPEARYEPEPEPKAEPEPEPESVPEYLNPESEFAVPEYETQNGSIGNNTNVIGSIWPEVYAEPEPPPMSKYYMPPMAVIAAILGLVIVIENVMVLFALLKGRPRQQSSMTYFIGNLSVADLISGIHLIWFTCFDYFLLTNKSHMYIMAMCSLWLVTVVVSVTSLFNFALHRLKLARSKDGHRVSSGHTFVMILFTWLIPIALLVVPPLAGWNCSNCIGYEDTGFEHCKRKCSQILFPFTKNYVLILAVLVLVAVVSLFVIYFWMLHSIHQKVNKLKKKGNMKKQEAAMIKTVLMILLLFTVCILPVAIILLLDYFTIEYNGHLITSFQIMSILSFINSVSNPFVYIWRLPPMRQALMRAVGWKTTKQENNSNSTKTFFFFKSAKRRETKSSPASISGSVGKQTWQKSTLETAALNKV